MTPGGDVSLLFVRAHRLTCAFPLEAVSEITRALPLRVLGGLPAYVRGASVIRGAATAVVDLSVLLGNEALTAPARYVVLRAGSPVALAVDGVAGVRVLPREKLGSLPRVLEDTGGEYVRSLLSLDGDLVPVMASAFMLPDEVLAAVLGRVGGGEAHTARGSVA